MTLQERLIEEIAVSGPITVADYMTRCLHDPDFGYYATRPALGEAGDFITAPLVSQMFGEVLAGWAHEIWTRMGRPERVLLVELGPGDGILMNDVLRAARADPSFAAACEVWLVETSAPFRARQAERIATSRWAARLEAVLADAPMILLANEFLDCLPIHQMVHAAASWEERRIGADAGALIFDPLHGEVCECSPEATALACTVGKRLAAAGGAALFIDYGRDEPGFGDTLQALRAHRKEGPLDNPGLADLTAHVDFTAFAEAARVGGAVVPPIETQGYFLRRLGIEHRAAALGRASPDSWGLIQRQLHRLIGSDEMGELFKVCALASPGLDLP